MTEREVSGGHPRPMNVLRMCQTPAHAHLLITGGTEGHTKLWDLRERDPTNRKYFKHSGAVTSLCFCPDEPHQFVVGLENGAIQRYDLRHQKNGRVWGAHGSKAVLDLQWKEGDPHMSGNGWLASAGADRTVQVRVSPAISSDSADSIDLGHVAELGESTDSCTYPSCGIPPPSGSLAS